MKKFTSLLLAVVMIFTMALATVSVSAAPINNEVVVGKTYTMSLTQAKLDNAVLYFSGKKDGNFLGTTENAAEAAILTVEAVEGGIRFSFMDGATKKYIDIYEYTSGKVGVEITETPSGIFVYDAESTTYVVNCIGNNYYLGTYNTFKTFSASKTSYITGDKAAQVGVSQFPAVFTESGSAPVVPPVDTAPVETTPEVTEAPATPAAPLLENATVADFGSFVPDAEGTKNTSYAARTNTDGWKAANAAFFTDKAFNGNAPMICINGKTSALGSITSSTVTGGIGKLAFNYGFPFSDNQFKITVTVYKASDNSILFNQVIEKTGLEKETVYSEILDINTAEDVIIEITNNSLTGTDKNKDRLGIWNLCWTKAESAPIETAAPETTPAPVETTPAPVETTAAPVETTAPEVSGDTGDNGVFFIAAAVAVVLLAGTAVVARKRED